MRSGAILLAVTVIVVYPLAFLLQGIDFTDMGFNLANQWLLLEDADSYSHGHLFYLANLLGGLWLEVTKPLGLLGAKLGWALVHYVTVYAAYRTLRNSGGQAGLFVGLAIALFWSTRVGQSWLSYNCLTAMFFTVAAYCLVTGLTRARAGLVLVSGILIGVTPFIRLPNVLALALIVAIPIYAYLAGQPRKWTLVNTGRFAIGSFIGVLGVLLLMYSLGHLPLYWESLNTRLSTSLSDTGYAYSGSQLLGRLFSDYVTVLVSTAIATAVLALSAWALTSGHIWRSRARAFPYLRMGAVLLGIGLLTLLSFSYVQANWASVVPGVLFVALAFRYWRVDSPNERLIVVVAALLLLITPLGSSNGIINSIYGMWLAIPLAFMTCFDEIKGHADRPWYSRPASVIGSVACAALLLVAFKHAEVSTYRDSGDRTRMIASIDHPYLRGALTTFERAMVVTELLNELPRYASPGDALLLHGSCALVHLLSETRPVLGSTWNGVYNTQMFKERLSKFDATDAEQPTVLLSKGSCRAREWPSYLAATATEVETRQELVGYMRKHDYQLRWQNAFFEIWTT